MISEALVVGLKEGVKIGVIWLVFRSYLSLNDRRHLMASFYLGLVLAGLLSAAVLLLPVNSLGRDVIGNIIASSFAVFLLGSATALLQASDVDILGWLVSSLRGDRNDTSVKAIIVATALLFFLPDWIGSFLFLAEFAMLKGSGQMTAFSVLMGCIAAAAISFLLKNSIKPGFIGRFFDLPQMLLFLAVVKLLGGGTKGISELSLIPSVQRGFMKFSHDFIHQTFVILMVPDHPLLKTTVWNFIGIFFGPNFASFAALFILLSFPLMFIVHSLFGPLPEREELTAAQQRKDRYLLISDKRRKALPVVLFMMMVFVSWFSESGESVSRLYDPAPKPVVVDQGTVLLPLHDPSMDLMDGMLHKFSLNYEGETIRMLAIKKADNAISICLDACEICLPKGYGQMGDHVVCIYCNTPIPVNTLGQPGGCNPIPLSFVVDENFIRIEAAELIRKWKRVRTGVDKGGSNKS